MGNNKLSAQWQGPYLITQVSPVSYRKAMADRKKNCQFHVNLLKQWHTPEASVLQIKIQEQDSDGEDEIFPFYNTTSEEGPVVNPSLMEQKQEQWGRIGKQLLAMSQGRSTQSNTLLTWAIPLHSGFAYCIPQAWQDGIREEVKLLMELGVIGPSNSPWASPIVTAKQNSGLRLCIDYHRLNSATANDPYRMPRVS